MFLSVTGCTEGLRRASVKAIASQDIRLTHI